MTKKELEEIQACAAWEKKLGKLLETFRDLGRLLFEVLDMPPKIYHAKVDEGLKVLEDDLKQAHKSWSNLNFLVETNLNRKMTACRLTDEEKEIMRLRYLSGLTFKQISRRLKIENVQSIHDLAFAKLDSRRATHEIEIVRCEKSVEVDNGVASETAGD